MNYKIPLTAVSNPSDSFDNDEAYMSLPLIAPSWDKFLEYSNDAWKSYSSAEIEFQESNYSFFLYISAN